MAELEQFCVLAQTQRNRACVALIQQVVSHKKIFVFGELLAMPSVQSVSTSYELCIVHSA
jgi:COP9 signalosome complex subunit 7